VSSLAAAWQLVRDLPVDLILDLWHLVRSGGSVADVAGVRPESVASIQLNGVAAVPLSDVRHEARHHRLLPDEGALDVAAALTELRRQGIKSRLAVEIWSDGLLALEPVAAAQRVYDATQRVLAAAEFHAEVI
jgi:sugar phosphate isomerase/epimerase